MKCINCNTEMQYQGTLLRGPAEVHRSVEWCTHCGTLVMTGDDAKVIERPRRWNSTRDKLVYLPGAGQRITSCPFKAYNQDRGFYGCNLQPTNGSCCGDSGDDWRAAPPWCPLRPAGVVVRVRGVGEAPYTDGEEYEDDPEYNRLWEEHMAYKRSLQSPKVRAFND